MVADAHCWSTLSGPLTISMVRRPNRREWWRQRYRSPLPGSLNNWHHVSSPVRIRRSNLFLSVDPIHVRRAWRGEQPHSRFSNDAHRADRGKFLIDDAGRLSGRPAPYMPQAIAASPIPESAICFATPRVTFPDPICSERMRERPARTCSSLTLAIDQLPNVHQELAVILG